MKRILVIVGLAVGVAAIGLLAYSRGWLFGSRSDDLGGRRAAGSGPSRQEIEVGALGHIEPVGRVIDLGGLPGDRVAVLSAVEGAEVKAGEVLAVLDSRPLRKLDVESAEGQYEEALGRFAAERSLGDARIAAAQLALEKAMAQLPDIDSQRQKVEMLRQGLEQLRRDSQRLADLPDDLVSKQERERQTLGVDQAAADCQAAQVLFDKLIVTSDLALRGAHADLQSAHANKAQVLSSIPVESLRAARDLAKAQFDRTEIKAPCRGVVLRVFARRGELIGNAPVLQMADVRRMGVVAEVYEAEVKRIRPEQTVWVQNKAFRSPYDEEGLYGKVTQIGKIISAPGLRPVDPFEPANRHVVAVRIELDKDDSLQSADFTDLQVDVSFLSGGRPEKTRGIAARGGQ
jgi:HlyD family secretion protein